MLISIVAPSARRSSSVQGVLVRSSDLLISSSVNMLGTSRSSSTVTLTIQRAMSVPSGRPFNFTAKLGTSGSVRLACAMLLLGKRELRSGGHDERIFDAVGRRDDAPLAGIAVHVGGDARQRVTAPHDARRRLWIGETLVVIAIQEFRECDVEQRTQWTAVRIEQREALCERADRADEWKVLRLRRAPEHRAHGRTSILSLDAREFHDVVCLQANIAL